MRTNCPLRGKAMIWVEYLKELKGAQKFGTCNSCGKWSGKDPAMVRVRFVEDGQHNASTIFLCDECRKLLHKII